MHLEKHSHSPTWYRFPPIIPRRNLFVMAQLDVVIANNTHFHLAFSCTIATLRSTWNKHCTYWSREREKYDALKHVPSSMFHFFSKAVCKLSITFVQTVKMLIYTLSNRFAQNVSILPIATEDTPNIPLDTVPHSIGLCRCGSQSKSRIQHKTFIPSIPWKYETNEIHVKSKSIVENEWKNKKL